MPNDADQTAIRELLDREAIRNCLYRYCRAVDRRDKALLKTIYWPEANDYHGAFNGPASEFVDHVMEFIKTQDLIQHSLGTIIIELAGKRAKVESYFKGYQRFPRPDGVMTDLFMGGRYLDRMEKRGGEWRTADRFVVYDWFREMPDSFDLSKELFGFVAVTGTQDENDKLYSWLGVKRG